MSDDAPNSSAPESATPPATPPATGKAPTLDGPWDEARGTALIANLRAELESVKGKLRTREDAEKSDLQRAQDRVTALETELSTARTQSLIAAAARTHKLPDDLLEFVTGSTADEINASAEKVATRFGASNPPPTTPPPSSRPQVRLVPGHASADAPPAFDPTALANQISAN